MWRNWRKLPWHLRYRTLTRLASSMRKAMVLATHRHCQVEFKGPVRLGPGFSLDIPDGGAFIVGPGVDFRRDFHCEISGTGRVAIGAGTIFTGDTLIQCTTSITIGQRCAFSNSTSIVDGNHQFRDPKVNILDQGYDYRPIAIGDGVWIGTRATIINDLGNGCVVGSHSLVTKPVPPYCLAVGVPARIVEFFGPPELRPADLDA